MITLLEFAKRTRDVYTAFCAGETGLCSATGRAAVRLNYPESEDGEYLEHLMDLRVSEAAPMFGGTLQGWYWPISDVDSRLACLDHIIKELEDESNQG